MKRVVFDEIDVPGIRMKESGAVCLTLLQHARSTTGYTTLVDLPVTHSRSR